MPDIQALLEISSARHSHLCPRQVLGVRMALAGAAALGMDVPRKDKKLLVIAETDGCFIDGVEVAAGVAVGRRTLRVEDYGKVAATFINVKSGEAIRLAPRGDVRERARIYAPEEARHYFAQLYGYQRMPADALFSFTRVVLKQTLEEIISRPGMRVNCCMCGEEIMNEREIVLDGQNYCRACFGPGYYQEDREVLPLTISKDHFISIP